MKRHLLPLGFALLIAACLPGANPGGPGAAKGAGLGPQALTSETISVAGLGPAGTAAPADPADPAPPGAKAAAAAQTPAAASAATTAQGGDLAQTAPVPRPEDLAAPPPDPAEPEADPAVAAEPLPPVSPEEAACVKKGGLWIRAGPSIAMACVKLTRDGGKQCRSERDCQGVCLARSMTCAPYDPLFGCNEVLQKDGTRVTLCIN